MMRPTLRLALRLTHFAGVMALLGLAGAPVLVYAEGRRPDETRGASGVHPMGDAAAQAIQEAAAAKMRGRMTPDERRRLRADVFDAGRSFYPSERPHGPYTGKVAKGSP